MSVLHVNLTNFKLLVYSFLVISAVFCVIVGIIFKKYLIDYENVPNAVEFGDVDGQTFDYVVVGAGTAGSVLAYKLSHDSNYTVLLIEAGENFNALSVVPS